MNITRLRAFRAVMRSGSASRAAKALGVTQPAISRMIADVERELGLALFAREGGRLVPTAEAVQFCAAADRAFSAFDEVADFAHSIRAGRANPVRVASLSTLSSTVLADAIVEFSKKHHGQAVSVFDSPHIDIPNEVASCRVDFGLCGHTDDPEVRWEHFGSAYVCAVVAHDMSVPEGLKKICSQKKLLLPMAGTKIRAAIDKVLYAEEISTHGAFEFQTSAVFRRIMSDGEFVGFASSLMVDADLFRCIPLNPLIELKYGIATPIEKPLSGYAADLKNEVSQCLGKLSLRA